MDTSRDITEPCRFSNGGWCWAHGMFCEHEPAVKWEKTISFSRNDVCPTCGSECEVRTVAKSSYVGNEIVDASVDVGYRPSR